MRYDPDTIPACEECASELLEDKLCTKCGVAYCKHFASDTDTRYCGNCMADFKVRTTTEIRTMEHINSEGDVTYKKRAICKRLNLEGTDWLFTAHKISSLNDEELDATIEYHRAIASAMLSEREDRRVEKYQKLNKVSVLLKKTRADVDQTGAVRGSLLTDAQKAEREANKKSKKTKITTKNDANAIADALALLLKNGLSAAKLQELLGSKK